MSDRLPSGRSDGVVHRHAVTGPLPPSQRATPGPSPYPNDVVVRQKFSNPNVIYSLATLSSPDQCTFRIRDEAIRYAVGYAAHAHVRAWFATSDHEVVLLGTFRDDEALKSPE